MESLRHSIKEPIPALFHAWELLTNAVDAHLGGDRVAAEGLFRQANLPEVWHWVNPAAGPSPRALRQNVRVLMPESDTQIVHISERDPHRHPTRKVKAAVLARDGHRCRYCGIPVVDADIRKIARALYPDEIPWIDTNEREQHAAFQSFWLQYDHVIPHSHGGHSSEDNIVVTCYLCNYGKDKYTLRQLGLSDPRTRSPDPVNWDGLERLRACAPNRPVQRKPHRLISREAVVQAPEVTPPPAHLGAFFLPGAWTSKGYLYTPPIDGKARWFKLGPKVRAELTVCNDVAGCRLLCEESELLRRGLSPESIRWPERDMSK